MVPPVIERARAFCRAGLEDAVGSLHPGLTRVCGYHLGWHDEHGNPAVRRGGRTLQAAMVLLAAEATGADPARAVPGAVAVELVHHFSLLHDDIIDGDTTRRGRPAAWVVFGTGPALLAGDALVAAATRTLAKDGGRAAGMLSDAVLRMTQACAAEADFDRRPATEIDLTDYLDVCQAKGGALLGAGALLGTVLCGRPEDEARDLHRAALHAGTAWQAVNDLENLWGDATLVGKPGFQDLRLGKKTLPVIAAMQSGHPAADHLEALLRGRLATEDDFHRAAGWIEEAGGRAAAERVAREHLDRALSIVDVLRVPGSVRGDLAELLEFTVTRTASAAGGIR